MLGFLLFALVSTDSLRVLQEGNQRYVEEEFQHQMDHATKRLTLAEGQSPFAIVVGCSDSRVPPEIIFDQGLGDLFTIRVAGNVIGDTQLDSIEYGATVLRSPLIVVLGHEGCAVVKSIFEGHIKDRDLTHIAPLVEPAITQKESLEEAIKAHVQLSVAKLKVNAVLQPLIKDGSLQVVGAYYDLKTGVVQWLK